MKPAMEELNKPRWDYAFCSCCVFVGQIDEYDVVCCKIAEPAKIALFDKIGSTRGGDKRDRMNIIFMLETKERRDFFDAYIKLIQ